MWAPVAVYAVLIFLESSIHQPPALPGAVSDKDVHAAIYAGLALLVLRALAAGRMARVTTALAAWAGLLATAYGATDEFHQRFVAGRTADLADLAADAVGAAVAVVVILLFARRGRVKR